MIEGKKVLGIIPARGGSKGLPGKNLLEVCGKPLIAWTIEDAKQSRYIDRLIVSSEDKSIISTANEWGCETPFTRPDHLATDKALTVDVIIHALGSLNENYDFIVLLQPTSPLRSHKDIDACIDACNEKNVTSCVTLTEAEKSPYWMYSLEADNRMSPVIDINARPSRRQELPTVYALNGAVYVVESKWFHQAKKLVDNRTIAHIMPKERSIDIDTEFDLNFFRYIVESRSEKVLKVINS